MPRAPHLNLEVLVPASPWYFRGRLFVGVLLLVVSVVPLGVFCVVVLETWDGRRFEGGFLFGAMAAFMSYFSVRHGITALRDGLGAERRIEGIIRALRDPRVGRFPTCWVELDTGVFRIPHSLLERLRVGQYVSARVGRFHGDLISLDVSGAK